MFSSPGGGPTGSSKLQPAAFLSRASSMMGDARDSASYWQARVRCCVPSASLTIAHIKPPPPRRSHWKPVAAAAFCAHQHVCNSVCILYRVQHLNEVLFHGKKTSWAANHLSPSVHRIASTEFGGGLLF